LELEGEDEIREESCMMGMIRGIVRVNCLTEEEIVLQLDALREVVPDAGLHALAAWFFTAIDNAGHNQGIRTEVTIADG